MNTNTASMPETQIVTVAVITYHSAATVLETLDSIFNQTLFPRLFCHCQKGLQVAFGFK